MNSLAGAPVVVALIAVPLVVVISHFAVPGFSRAANS